MRTEHPKQKIKMMALHRFLRRDFAPWIGILCLMFLAGAVPAAITLGGSCATADCHSEMTPGPGVHGPLNVGNCSVCHETLDGQHAFRPAREGNALCGMCHELSLKNVVHSPVAAGDCTSCHDPHQSSIEPLLLKQPDDGLCIECHQDDAELDANVLHGPVRAGLCMLCHEAHSSDNSHLVRQGGNDLCMFCHSEEIARIEQIRHPHEPVAEGNCLSCHNPHGGETASLTHEPPPGICYTCHQDLEEQIEESANVHGAVTDGDACSACHNTHGSSLAGLLRQGELDLCLSCHNEEIEIENGETISDIATLIESSEFLHGPVKEGNCTECHAPHASESFGLLEHDYPSDFYAPYQSDLYTLCFQCHEQESFVAESTETLTNFRNSAQNLHFVHVADETRGRTCRACHEVHASDLPFHMSTGVPYGDWELPINFEMLDDGGRCSPGCHEPMEYHRSEMEMNDASPADDNAGGK